jgi:hypothetical protein
MRKKRLFKILGVSVGALVIFLLLFAAAFVFNPFEGSLADIRGVVPRRIDFFLRKPDLAGDFAEFPEPLFFDRLSQSPAWRELRAQPAFRRIAGDGGVEHAIRQAEEVQRQLAGAHLDLLGDVAGREVLLAGRYRGGTAEDAAWCAYARVSWKIRAAWGLAAYGFVIDRAREQGIVLTWEEDLLRIEPDGAPQPLYAARAYDCVMFGNDRELVVESRDLALGVSRTEAFGGSASYVDAITGRIARWQEQTGAPRTNAFEYFLHAGELLQRVTWDDGWPNANDRDDMNSRVLASFVNLKGWQFLAGALLVEPDSLSLLARVELNRNFHTDFQSRFFKTEEQNRAEWLDPFLGMVPHDACATAGLRMPAGDFLREMFQALLDEERSQLNEAIKKTGDFNDFDALVARIEPALMPRSGFVFRKNEPDPDPRIKVLEPSPVPQIAWVFWLRPGQERVVDGLLEKMRAHHKTFGFTSCYLNPLGISGGATADAVSEFVSPQIAGTGMVAAIVFGSFFVVSNSGPLIVDMFRTRLGRRASIAESSDLRTFFREVPPTVNGFAFVQAPQLEAVLRDYLRFTDVGSAEMDPEWATEQRPNAEAAVFREKYAREAPSIASLPQARRDALEQDVTQKLREMWQQSRSEFTAEDRERYLTLISLARLFSSAYFQVGLDPQWIELTGRVLVQYR